MMIRTSRFLFRTISAFALIGAGALVASSPSAAGPILWGHAEAVQLDFGLGGQPIDVRSNGETYTGPAVPPLNFDITYKVSGTSDLSVWTRVKGFSLFPRFVPAEGTEGPEFPSLQEYGMSHTWPVGQRPKEFEQTVTLTVYVPGVVGDFMTARCNALAASLAEQGLSKQEIFGEDRLLHYNVGADGLIWQTGIGVNTSGMVGPSELPLKVRCMRFLPEIQHPDVADDVAPLPPFAADSLLNEAEDMPINITGGTIAALDPPYVGHCPAQADFRATLQGTGHGEVRVWAFNENQDPVYVSGPLPFYNTKGAWSFDFPYDIKWEGPQSLETKEHVLQLRVTYKNKDEPYFPANQVVLDHTSWSARCLPKTTVDIGGSDGGGLGAFQQAPAGDAASELTLQPVTDLPSATIQLPTAGQRPSLQRDRVERQRETSPRLPERQPQAPAQPVPQ